MRRITEEYAFIERRRGYWDWWSKPDYWRTCKNRVV